MIHLVDLDAISPNPWQTRQEFDPTYIAELALDIADRRPSRPDTCGLLQVPIGRIVDSSGSVIIGIEPHPLDDGGNGDQ